MGETDELLEKLAALEHEQWLWWSQNIAEVVDDDARLDRWERDYWVPYDELPEDAKEDDRRWARRAMEIAVDHLEGDDG